jgi:hypothetical protein
MDWRVGRVVVFGTMLALFACGPRPKGEQRVDSCCTPRRLEARRDGEQ